MLPRFGALPLLTMLGALKLVSAMPVTCPEWCTSWQCDGSMWCANGQKPTPCAGCQAGTVAGANCPEGYHACPSNEQQPTAFCDTDADCYGDDDYCSGGSKRQSCVITCPAGYNVCPPNSLQRTAFCDIDADCYGDDKHSDGRSCVTACVVPASGAPDENDPMSNPQLSLATCRLAFQDPKHLFHRMWAVEAREQNHLGDKACWDKKRDAKWVGQSAATYFNDIALGLHCQTDWYAGSGEAHGYFSAGREAPALLGFDNDIHGFCQGSCDQASVNILNLFSGPVDYNTCRNFEWQLCAAHGKLKQQASGMIVFARAPKTVSFSGFPQFGVCSGYTNKACDDWSGFANDDIYYLEVCLFAQVCENADEMFRVEQGNPFYCDFSATGLEELRGWLLGGGRRLNATDD